jgi:hypothetical protein
MIMDLDDHAAFVKWDLLHELNQIVRDSSFSYMLENYFHGRGVCETTLLLIESEVGWMEM